MATPSKKGKYLYEANDLVDDFLFNKVVKHVNIEHIEAFGLKLGGHVLVDPSAGEVHAVSRISFGFVENYRNYN